MINCQRWTKVAEKCCYTLAPDGNVSVQCLLQEETIWLTQQQIADLFGVEVPAISKHLANIYESRELERERTVSKMETVRREGERHVKRKLDYYSLDAIIAVGYRVSSYQATQFRIWATRTLKEFLIKGFALDDERLKQGQALFGKDYFDELLERIREIQASERSLLSEDYRYLRARRRLRQRRADNARVLRHRAK